MDEKKPPLKETLIDLLLSVRVWILLLFLLVSAVAINYTTDSTGIVINGVGPNSAAENAGFEVRSNVGLRSLEKVISLNGEIITSQEQFFSLAQGKTQLEITTSKGQYTLDLTNSTGSIQESVGLSFRDAPTSNIKLGIELEGGSRLILAPLIDLSTEDFDLLVNTLQSRLDVYGASGTKVNKLEDAFSGDKFVIVESTSSNKNDIFELIKRQGVFEAVIANKTVFTGDDVFRVFSDPQNARLEGCNGDSSIGFVCTYGFLIELNSNGADAFFNVTKNLGITQGRLSEEVCFNLDGQEMTCLTIASSFKYQKVTTPQITVTGDNQNTRERGIDDAKKEMEFLQAILSTQSLPSELEVVQSYSISSSLGEKLLENAFLVGLASLLVVAGIVALRYRHFGIFVGIFIALLTEVIIVMGMAAFLRLSIDLAAIGGLIAAIGTGVDDQIIITDEYFRKRNKNISSRKKIKHAFYIIMIAYFTTLAAMVPLYFAGLKILQGFAFMIIIGVTVGVFVTRPAYGVYLRLLMTTRKERKEEDE